MLYGLVRFIARLYLSVVFGFRVTGREHIPPTGSLIVAANHSATLDPVALACAFPRPVYFMGKAELFRNPIAGAVLRKLNSFPVKRGQIDRDAYRRTMDIIRGEKVLGIFPEGTRSGGAGLLEPHPGAARFSLQCGVPVVPVAIIGTHASHRTRLPGAGRPKIRVMIGDPLWPEPPEGGRIDRADIDKFSSLIMDEVRELMQAA